MFLSILENYQQKEAFIELAKLIVHADDEIGSEEITMLEAYKHELQIDYNVITKATRSLNEVINVFKSADIKIKIAIFIEALALVLADKNEHEFELNIVHELRNGFDISTLKEQECRDWLKELNQIYSKAQELLT